MPAGGHLTLLRHGECFFEASGRRPGLIDTELTEQGLETARRAAEVIKALGMPVAVVLSSPLERASRTARIVAREQVDGPPVRLTWELMDRHLGAYTGKREREVQALMGPDYVRLDASVDGRPPELDPEDPVSLQVHHAWHQLPVAVRHRSEALGDVVSRVRELWERLAGRAESSHVVVVAHEATLRALRVVVEGLPEHQIATVTAPPGYMIRYDLTPRDRPSLTPVETSLDVRTGNVP